MTRSQAIKMAKKLAVDGMHYEEIGKALHKEGFGSRRGGTPLKAPGISHLLINSGYQKRPSPKKGKPTAQPKTNRLSAVRSILTWKDMEASERIALALLVIG